jgi:ABC-2 type transport system ATP-binding protein
VIHDSPNGAASALALRGLVKRFDAKVAVAGVDLDVASGSFFGLLGPNGAGKTTILSMGVGLLRPTAGNAYVLGLDVWSDPVRAKRLLGVLPDGVRMFDRLTGSELLAYNGLLRGMDAGDEPFEAVDPVSAALIRDILHRYVRGGGTVVFSSHVMEVVEKLCTHVAIMNDGLIRAVGTLDDIRAGRDLEEVFVAVVGGRTATGQELSWL